MRTLSSDRLLLAASALLAAGSAAWFGLLAPRTAGARVGAAAPPPALAATAYAPVGRDAPAVKAETWNPPPAQTRGRDWVYEVFTPPEIFYDPISKQFSASPPAIAPVPPPEPPFGLTLLEVRREPFRLQLVGYVGGEGSCRGLFENVRTTETFLAGGEHRVPDLGLVIETLELRRAPATREDSMTGRPVAVAVVRDERTGRRVTLTNLERYFPDAPLATVRVGDGEPQQVREGDRLPADGVVFHIGRIHAAPAALEVTRTPAGGGSDVRTLTLPSAAPPATP